MKRLKLLYLLLLIPFIGFGQVSTGNEQMFDYGLQNLAPQTVTTPTYIGTAGTDGTLGIIPSAYIEKTAKKQNSMTVDGTGTLYPTVDAVNLQANTIAKTLTNVGLLEVGNDAFQMARQDDTHLNVTGTSLGVIFPARYNTPPYAPSDAVRQVPTNTNYPLQNFLSYLPTSSTQGVFYIGWRDTTQAFELSTSSYVQNPDVFQCGIIFLKNVAGTISFIDSTRTVYAIPDVSQYSNLETTAIGVKSNVFMSPNTGGMTVKNSSGSVVGLSVCYKCSNNDEKAIAANATTTFRRLNPGNANATTLPTLGTTVAVTDYWNGSAMVALTANGNASVQRWLVTVLGTIILQSGEAQYTNFQEGKDNAFLATFTDLIPKGTFVEIGRMVAVKNTTDLGDNTKAVFLTSSGGGGSGSTGTSLQLAYNSSTAPQITTSTTLGAFELKRGSAADSDNVLRVSNGAGTQTAAFTGAGDLTCNSVTSPDLVHLAGAETITGVKTFNDGKIGHRNVANTFTSFFTNANTASRTYTLPDKSGTVAMTSDTFSSYQTLNVSTYTFALSDANGVINNTFAGATYTVPTNSVVAFPVGSKITIYVSSAATFTINGAGVTFFAPNGLISNRASWFVLTKLATDTWLIQADVTGFSQSGSNLTTGLPVSSTEFRASTQVVTPLILNATGSNQLQVTGGSFIMTGSLRSGFSAITLTDINSWTANNNAHTYTSYYSNPTLNQTGGFTGVSRGYYVNPSLTNVYDFRAFEATTGSIVFPYLAKTATYSISNNDYLIDSTSGTFTETLPTAVGCTGKIYVLKNSGSGVITIATTSSQTIDGASTYSLSTQYKYVTVVSNGANWIITANN